MVLDNFRRKLRQEAELWRAEGLIDNSQYQQIAERYQFNNLETVARDRFVIILIALGSVLLGLGVITFVAANWQAWSKELKLTVLMSLFFATNIAGFYLWKLPPTVKGKTHSKNPRRRQQMLGHGLLVLGALILGANLALLSQMFHIGGSGYELYLSWGLGVLTMAYSLRLTSLGIFALLLVQVGYWMGLPEWYYTRELTWTHLVVQHMPLLAGVLFVPLAYRCRSRWIFTLAAIAVATSLQFNLKPLQSLRYSDALPWVASAAFALPPALLWSYDDLLWPKVNFRLFQPITRTLALVFFSILFYVLSFRLWWESPSNGFYQPVPQSSSFYWLPFVDVAILAALALWQWWHLLRQKHNRHNRGLDLTTIVIGCFIIITALVPFVYHNMTELGVVAIFVFNALLATFACGLIREGLELGQRNIFWGGMVLLTLQITTRMLEYNTGLLFKSFVFVLCGVAVIGAGLWFEHHLSSLSRSSSHQ